MCPGTPNSRIVTPPGRLGSCEAIMSTLSKGMQCGSNGWSGRVQAIFWSCLNLHILVAKQVNADTTANPATPVVLEERSITNRHQMEQNAHLALLAYKWGRQLRIHGGLFAAQLQ